MRFFVLLMLMTTVFLGVEQSFADRGTNVNSVTFVQHFDENTAHEAMQNGVFDIYYYPVSHSLTDNLLGIHTFDSTGGVRYNLFVNPAEIAGQFNPFAHQQIRYSLNFLVDRDAIVRDLFEGHGGAIISSFGPTHPDYILVYRQLDALGIQYDPQTADMMITDVLATEGATKKGGMWFIGDDPITIKMFIRNDDPIRESIGQSLAVELEDLGFAVDITTGNLQDAFGTVFGSDPAEFGWHIYTGAWEGATVTKYDDVSLRNFYAPWGSFMPGRNNPDYWNYENAILDEITQKIYSVDYENVEQRANLVRQATLEGVQESVRMFLNINNDRYITKDNVSGVVNVPGYGITHRATPINAEIEDGSLAIGVKYISQGAWNPVLGFEDAYSINIYDILHDPAITRDPVTGDLTPVRSTWEVTTAGPEGAMDIPDDAIDWDPASQEWRNIEQGSTARSAVIFDFKFSNWHNGVPMDINDVLYPTYLFTEWGANDSDNPDDIDKYNEAIASSNTSTIKGIRILNDTTIQVYTDYWHFDDAEIVAEVSLWSSVPWEIYASMEKVVLDGDAAFSNSDAVENDIPWLSLLENEDSELIKAALEDFASNNTVPAGLYSDQVDPSLRYGASIQWIIDRGNAVISNGPFYLDSYSPDTQTLEAVAFDDETYPLEPGHWNYLAADRGMLKGEVVIGSLAPVTGGASNYGADISEASALAVEHFNEYLERRDASWSLAVERRDTATDPTTALRELVALNTAGIKIIDGPALDYEQSVLEFANDNDMLLVSCCSVTTPLAKDDDSLFRIVPGHSNHADKLANLMHEEGITAVVPVGLDAIWVNDLLALASASFTSLNQANTADHRISYGSDMTNAVADLASTVKDLTDVHGTDRVAVLYVGFEENVEFIKLASQHDILDDVRWFGAELNTVYPNAVNDSIAGSFAERVGLTSVQPKVHNNQITKEILDHFTSNDQFDRPPSVYANFEYDVVWILGLSLLEAQSTDVSSVKTALAEVSGQYVGASGNTALNTAGDRIDGQYAIWKVKAAPNQAPQWIEVEESGSISGRVFSDADGNGIFNDGTDSGIGGTEIIAVDITDMQVISTTTATDGTFVFENVEYGTALIQIKSVPQEYIPSEGSPHYSYVTTSPGAAAMVDFVLEARIPANTGTISGIVFTDINGNGLHDAGEPGIEGHEMIAFEYLTGQLMVTNTVNDGTYTFRNITPDPDTVLVQTGLYPNGHLLSSSDWFMYMTAGVGSTATFDVGFRPIADHERVTLEVLVYSDDNLNGQIDPDEVPVEGVAGLYVWTYTIGQVASPIPGGDGRATIDDIVPADFELLAIESQLAEYGYVWASTNYERDDGITENYDSAMPIVANPAPGSTHTIMVGLVPLPQVSQ